MRTFSKNKNTHAPTDPFGHTNPFQVLLFPKKLQPKSSCQQYDAAVFRGFEKISFWSAGYDTMFFFFQITQAPNLSKLQAGSFLIFIWKVSMSCSSGLAPNHQERKNDERVFLARAMVELF